MIFFWGRTHRSGFGLWFLPLFILIWYFFLDRVFWKTIDACDHTTVHADVVLKGTTVDSIYNCHSRNNNGSAFEHISFRELVSRGFTAMDMTALNICEENSIPGKSMLLYSLGLQNSLLYSRYQSCCFICICSCYFQLIRARQCFKGTLWRPDCYSYRPVREDYLIPNAFQPKISESNYDYGVNSHQILEQLYAFWVTYTKSLYYHGVCHLGYEKNRLLLISTWWNGTNPPSTRNTCKL